MKPLETQLNKGYSVHFLQDEDLINFQATLDSMPLNNRIIVFDDVSFLNGSVSKKELDKIKNAMTKIRHTSAGSSVKTVIIFNYHYSKSLDIYIRDTVCTYHTSIRKEELKNLKGLLTGKKASQMLNDFLIKYSMMSMGKPITFRVSKSDTPQNEVGYVKYEYSNPFRIALFSDSLGIRYCVYPDSSKIVPENCQVCNGTETAQEINPDEILEFLSNQFGEKAVKSMIRYMAIETIRCTNQLN